MSTKIEISDDLYEKVKAQADEQGVEVVAFIETAIKSLVRDGGAHGTKRIDFPIIHSDRPGTLTMEAIRKAEDEMVLEEDRKHADPA